MNTFELDRTYVAGTYNRFPIEIVEGKGSVVTDSSGKQYIDMGSGIAVTSFGVADPEWVAAVESQLRRVQHMSNLYYTEPCAKLAEALCRRTGMSKVFFSNSGAEANECAIKVARKYASDKWAAEQEAAPGSAEGNREVPPYTIVTLKNSFHGRTLTTLAATGQDVFHKMFTPLTPGFAYAEANNMEDLKAVADSCRPAAVMIECIQGEGGVRPLSPDFIRGAWALCQAEDVPLIIDEVQTGNGRTGKLYSYMHFGIRPDIVSTAKGLGGGLPLGACLLGEKVQDVFHPGDHGSTFGGNPVCCAGALSVLEQLDDAMLESVKEKGAYLREKLSAMGAVQEVRGMGLMLGVGLKEGYNASALVGTLLEQGVLCLTAGHNTIRLLPPLVISQAEMDKGLPIMGQVLA